jgi:hypothetical protein
VVDPIAYDDTPPETDAPEENEVLREARRAKELAERAIAKVGWKTAAGIGIGVGSAALLAALLYSGRSKSD